MVVQGYNGGDCYLMNHAVGGHSIMTNMDAQTVAAASDAADIILILLGTNDVDDAGVTAEYQENLEELKTSNASATIYGMSILNRTAGEATRLVNNTRIQTACANAGVTYWDTEGWIDAATETSDGTHPTAAGHVKIAAQVLARL
jgi:lysophospholipase L1-like esterase